MILRKRDPYEVLAEETTAPDYFSHTLVACSSQEMEIDRKC